jgi:hypothetical protein
MSFLNFLHRIWHGVTNQPAPAVLHHPQPDVSPPVDDLPPGFILIETQISGQTIDGTGRWIGQDARVGQMPSGELITCERTRGIRCGCGHIVYSAHEIATQTGTYAGIGGICPDCATEAGGLVAQGVISASQAEAMALYCTQCASHCDGCGRHNLCSQHTRMFQEMDGRQQQLCPECLKKARSKKLFKQTLATMARLFAEDDERPGPKQRESYYDG